MPPNEPELLLLRSALRRLYDAAALRNSPLVAAFGLGGSADPATALRQHLTKAIRSLQPEPDMPADTQAWRVYEILLYRYVQRSGQLDVAEQLGLSTRHLARLEQAALAVLADRLGLPCRAGQAAGALAQAASPIEAVSSPAGTAGDEVQIPIEDELTWLGASGAREAVNLIEVLSTVMELACPLAERHGVTLVLGSCQQPPMLAMHPVALRQILLSVLSVAIRRAPGESVVLAVQRQGWSARMEVLRSGQAGAGTAGGEADQQARLGLARRLAEAYGGTVEDNGAAWPTMLSVTLPALEQLAVLAIDDNANTLRLMQRYLSNTRYHLRGAASLPEGLAQAREALPRIIVLDVMMPDMDGWEALGRLRQHPLTARTPVLICTILAEEELALSLGASGYLRKPFSREAFVRALDQLAGPAEPGID